MSEDERMKGTGSFFEEDIPEEELGTIDTAAQTGTAGPGSSAFPSAGAAGSMPGVMPQSTGAQQGQIPAVNALTKEQEKALKKQEKEARRNARREKSARNKKKVQDGIQKGAEMVGEVRKEIEADDRELKETSRKNLRILIMLAVVVVLAAAIAFLFSDRVYNAMQGKSSYVLEDMGTSVIFNEGSTTLLLHEGRLLRCSQDGLMAINDKGKVVYDIPYTMSSPYPVVSGDYVSVADRLGMSLVLIQGGQLLMTKTTESNILLNTVNSLGQTCVVLSAPNGHLVTLYDTKGDIMMQRRTYSITDGLPMCLALSDDGSRMATVYANYTGSELTTIVTVFDLTETGAGLIDRIVGSVSYPNCLISDIRFIGNELFYLGTDRMGRLTTGTAVNAVWETQLAYEVKTMCMSDDFFAILYGSGQAGTAVAADNNIVVYSYGGEILNQFYVENASYVDAWGDTLIYSEGRGYYGVSSTGKAKWVMNNGDTFGRMVAYENGKTVAVTQAGKLKFYKVTLRGVDGEYVD